MRQYLIVACTALALSGCASPGTGGGTMPQTVSQIQAITQGICGFLPTAATVIGLFSHSAGLNTAVDFATAICAAVTPTKTLGARKRATAPVVNGVAIKGQFVQ